jgi:hypothetical protein
MRPGESGDEPTAPVDRSAEEPTAPVSPPTDDEAQRTQVIRPAQDQPGSGPPPDDDMPTQRWGR